MNLRLDRAWPNVPCGLVFSDSSDALSGENRSCGPKVSAMTRYGQADISEGSRRQGPR